MHSFSVQPIIRLNAFQVSLITVFNVIMYYLIYDKENISPIRDKEKSSKLCVFKI